MPKDYTKAKVYRIHSLSGDKTYIGSTTAPTLSHRFSKHKGGYKIWVKCDKKRGKGSTYTTSYELFEEYGIDNCVITLLPMIGTPRNKDELRAVERTYIESTDCVNKYIPGRTIKESNGRFNPINNKKMACCPYCDKEFLNTNLYKHINICKKLPIEPVVDSSTTSQESASSPLPTPDAV